MQTNYITIKVFTELKFVILRSSANAGQRENLLLESKKKVSHSPASATGSFEITKILFSLTFVN